MGELRTNKILGIGTFSTVTRVTIDNDQQQQQHQDEPTNESRGEVVVDRRRRFGLRRPTRYYACKSVKKSIVEMGENAVLVGCREDNIMYRREYVNAIAQIANEIHVLSSFDHPNIIKIRGSYCNEKSVVSSASLSRSVSSATSSQSQQHQLNTDKFDICLQLASALEYVHSRNVIYRDLKSSNVGFAADGTTLQLFDFG